jgi:hypothetical protein
MVLAVHRKDEFEQLGKHGIIMSQGLNPFFFQCLVYALSWGSSKNNLKGFNDLQ